ncbi:MAG TPA: hypothetical protein VFA50_08080 [Stellaceae bacterium]|nr:hypothetical protein [Stellaceae bacterium]
MIGIDDLRTLAATEATPAVSMFMPTHIAGREIRQDAIRLRRLVGAAL